MVEAPQDRSATAASLSGISPSVHRTVLVALTFALSFGAPLAGTWLAFNHAFPRAVYGQALLIYTLCGIANLVGSLGLDYQILRLGAQDDTREARQKVVRELLESYRLAAPASVVVAFAACVVAALGLFGPAPSALTLSFIFVYIVIGVFARLVAAAFRVLGALVASIVVDRIVREGGLLWGALAALLFPVPANDMLALALASSLVFCVLVVGWSSAYLGIVGAVRGSGFLSAPFDRDRLAPARDLALCSIGELVFIRTDVVVLGLLIPPAVLAPYGYYSYLLGIASTGFIFLNFVYYPRYAAEYRDGSVSGLRRLAGWVGRLSLLSGAAIMLGLVVLQLLSDRAGVVLTRASLLAPLFLVLSVGQVAALAFGAAVPGLIVMGRAGSAALSYAVGIVLRIVAVWIGLRSGGLLGAALGSATVLVIVKGAQWFLFDRGAAAAEAQRVR